MTYFMTQIILKQGTRGDHGFMREVGVVGEGLKECLELEVRSERVRWPLCGELLQLASDGFGGHWESRHAWEDQRSFKLMQNGAWSCPGFAWDNPTDHFGTYLPSFNFPRTATIRRKKILVGERQTVVGKILHIGLYWRHRGRGTARARRLRSDISS